MRSCGVARGVSGTAALSSQRGTAGRAEDGVVLRGVDPGAQHVPVVPFQRVLLGQTVISDEGHRLLDRGDRGAGRDELGDGGVAGGGLVIRVYPQRETV